MSVSRYINLAMWGFHLWFQFNKVVFFLSLDLVWMKTRPFKVRMGYNQPHLCLMSGPWAVWHLGRKKEWTPGEMLTGSPQGSTSEEDQSHLKWQAEGLRKEVKGEPAWLEQSGGYIEPCWRFWSLPPKPAVILSRTCWPNSTLLEHFP